MERILSKEEIGELLSAVRQGEIEIDPEPEAEKRAPGEFSRLDLVRSGGQGRMKVGNFDLVLDSFGRNYGVSLTNRLQQPVSLQRTNIETMEFEAFLQLYQGRGAIGVFHLEPLRWGGVLTLDEQFAFAFVEILLGGAGETNLKVPDRPLTAIEMNVAKAAFRDACDDLAKAFRPLEETRAILAKIESNPRLINIIPPDAQVMVTTFKASVNNVQGQMCLVIPHVSLEPLREKIRDGELSTGRPGGGNWNRQVSQEVTEMEVCLAAQLGALSLRVRDILNFQVGDIIELGGEPGSQLRILVEGKPKYLGQGGVRNGKRAIRITGRNTNGAEHGKNGN